MNTKFTKGEWKADLESLASINRGEKHIAMVNYFNTNNKDNCVNEVECIANASLIAAAPDMYAMLKECGASSNEGAFRDGIYELLAKARGETK